MATGLFESYACLTPLNRTEAEILLNIVIVLEGVVFYVPVCYIIGFFPDVDEIVSGYHKWQLPKINVVFDNIKKVWIKAIIVD